MEIIVIDDDSTDKTLVKSYNFVDKHQELTVKILKQNPRKGKASALNMGLKASSNNIIVVSDADTFWPVDILKKVMPFVSNNVVGAVTGHGVPLLNRESWTTEAEKSYLNLINLLRLGESKIHSTIRFEGCFCVFKKSAFDKFDDETGADDSGTALKVIQNGFRAILVPEVFAYIDAPNTIRKRIQVKKRRAIHLNGLWLHCLKLLFKRCLVMPKRIAIPEIFLSIFNPIIFVTFSFVTLILVVSNPIFLIPLILSLCISCSIPIIRKYLVHGILDQLILFYSVLYNLNSKKILSWDT